MQPHALHPLSVLEGFLNPVRENQIPYQAPTQSSCCLIEIICTLSCNTFRWCSCKLNRDYNKSSLLQNDKLVYFVKWCVRICSTAADVEGLKWPNGGRSGCEDRKGAESRGCCSTECWWERWQAGAVQEIKRGEEGAQVDPGRGEGKEGQAELLAWVSMEHLLIWAVNNTVPSPVNLRSGGTEETSNHPLYTPCTWNLSLAAISKGNNQRNCFCQIRRSYTGRAEDGSRHPGTTCDLQQRFPNHIVDATLRPNTLPVSERTRNIIINEPTASWEDCMEEANEQKRIKTVWKTGCRTIEGGCRECVGHSLHTAWQHLCFSPKRLGLQLSTTETIKYWWMENRSFFLLDLQKDTSLSLRCYCKSLCILRDLQVI